MFYGRGSTLAWRNWNGKLGLECIIGIEMGTKWKSWTYYLDHCDPYNKTLTWNMTDYINYDGFPCNGS